MKVLVVLLSIGFLILGLAGVAANMTLWLSWLVLIAGALGTAASLWIPSDRSLGEATVALLEGVAAGVLWVIALATRHHAWVAWWTFAFGVAFLISAAVDYGASRTGAHAPA